MAEDNQVALQKFFIMKILQEYCKFNMLKALEEEQVFPPRLHALMLCANIQNQEFDTPYSNCIEFGNIAKRIHHKNVAY